eukprot:m.310647 g.310647  ORF g.310647 m.310647 type:complete len:475 (+) comp53474_c0_seq1:26-1450(+)
MRLVFLLFLLPSWSSETSPPLIGGCAGTRYGCCPDGATSAKGPAYSGCPNSRVNTSAECDAFLSGLPLTCLTQTSCINLDCYTDVLSYHIEIDFVLHRCAEPVSMNVTLRIDTLDFYWNHKFFGNTSMFVPGLEIPLGGLGKVSVATDVHIYKRNGVIYASNTVYAYFGKLVLANIVVLKDGKLPIETADCLSQPPPSACPGCSSSCLKGQDGDPVCYQCPIGGCPPAGSHPVCGSDLRTHDSECLLRQTACKANKVVDVEHSGPCGKTPAPLQVVTLLPSQLSSLSPSERKFVDFAVAQLLLNVTLTQTRQYDKSYIAAQLASALDYRVVVMKYLVRLPKNGSNDVPQVLVYFFAYYHQSTGDAVVPVNELISVAVNQTRQISQLLQADLIKIGPFDTTPAVTPQDDSNTSVIIIAVVCATGGILITLAILTFVYYYQRKRVTGSLSPEDVSYLPQHDEISFEAPVYSSDSSA